MIKRHRTNIIGIQTSILAWVVEFVTGSLVWMDLIFGFTARKSWERVFISVADLFLFSVVQPFAYIIKTRKVKDLISNGGWYNTLRGFLTLDSKQVSPAEVIEMNPVVNDDRTKCERQKPISTISECVELKKTSVVRHV